MLKTYGSVLLPAVTVGSPMESLSQDSTGVAGRLIDSLRAESGVLIVRVTPQQELIYGVTVNGEPVVATRPLAVSAVESWAEIAGDLVPSERPGRTAAGQLRSRHAGGADCGPTPECSGHVYNHAVSTLPGFATAACR